MLIWAALYCFFMLPLRTSAQNFEVFAILCLISLKAKRVYVSRANFVHYTRSEQCPVKRDFNYYFILCLFGQ